jgi:two-component system response regulator NreC
MVDKVIKVLLADDHAILRAGLRSLLNAEADMDVVGEASNGAQAVKLVADLHPHVVVMDLTMPDMSGLSATRLITADFPETRVLVLTMHAEEQYILAVLEAGGAGYVLKSAADDDLIHAIRQVSQGKPYLYEEATRVLINHYRRQEAHDQTEAAEDSLALLSEREREVLVFTARGYSSREIGEMLHISSKTVDTYRQRFMDKLDLHSRVDLVGYALRKELLKYKE